MVVQIIKRALQDAVSSLKLSIPGIHLEHPADENHGDYSSNVAMMIFSDIKNQKSKIKNTNQISNIKKPRELASMMVEKLQRDKELENVVSKIEVAGAGFINFWLNEEYLIEMLQNTITTRVKVPTYSLGNHKKILFEFAHFNTHKAVHIGHLRNISLGESLSRIMEALGNRVVRVSYGGDVGMHIAKCLYGIMQIKKEPKTLREKTDLLAKAYTEGNNAFEDDEEAKREIAEVNKKIYRNDPDIMKLWEETRQWSFDQFEQIYQRIDTKFDRLYYESEVFERGTALCQVALKKGILKESDGAIIFDGEPYGLDKRVFITSEGNPTYEGKELGIAELEFTKHGDLDKAIHVVAPEQTSFFKVTFKVEELLNPELYKSKQEHFAYGYVRLTSGKMSSRKGTIVLADWLLDEAKRRIQKAYPDMTSDMAEIVAIAAAKYSFLKINAQQDISFDFDQSISLEGNSGPYLQYAYARCRSVLAKSDKKSYTLQVISYTKEELAILRTLYKFPEVVLKAGKTFSPNLIANYLYDLAQKYNLFYQKVSILNAKEEEEKEFRLALTAVTAQVLKNGLHLLGIKVLEKM